MTVLCYVHQILFFPIPTQKEKGLAMRDHVVTVLEQSNLTIMYQWFHWLKGF